MAGLLGGPHGQRCQGHQRLDRRLHRRLHRRRRTDNPQGAQAVVDWLLSEPVQAAIPDSMYVYPVDDEVALPELWAQWAQVAEDPIVVHPRQIEAERETWLREWADIATG